MTESAGSNPIAREDIERSRRVRVPRPGRLPLIALLVVIGLGLAAWPLTRYLLPDSMKPGRGPFEYPGITWVMLDEVPGRFGSFNLVANVDWHQASITTVQTEAFLRELVEQTKGKYSYYQVRIFNAAQRLLVEAWSDGDAGKINMKPGAVPLQGPVEIEGMRWMAVGSIPLDNATKPRLTAEVKFDEPRVISVPHAEYAMGQLIRHTWGRYAEYQISVYNHSDVRVLDLWANGAATQFRALPTDDYYRQ
jgi:hypothetical protein